MTACLACLAFAMSGAAGPAEAPPSPPSSERPSNVAPRRRILPPVIPPEVGPSTRSDRPTLTADQHGPPWPPPREEPAWRQHTTPRPTMKAPAPAVRPPDPADQRLDRFTRGVIAVLIAVAFILLGKAVEALPAGQERRRVARGGKLGVAPHDGLMLRVPPQ